MSTEKFGKTSIPAQERSDAISDSHFLSMTNLYVLIESPFLFINEVVSIDGIDGIFVVDNFHFVYRFRRRHRHGQILNRDTVSWSLTNSTLRYSQLVTDKSYIEIQSVGHGQVLH